VVFRKKKIRFIILVLLFLIAVGFYKINAIEKIFYPYPYKQIITKYAAAYGVDPLFVVAVIREESHFRPKSSSHKGALGLMQLMPDTAKEISAYLGEDYAQANLENPEVNIRYGTWYLAQLNKQFSGNSVLVLAAYNAGSGRVNNWLNFRSEEANTYLIEDIPFKETREYVQKVLRSYKMYVKLYDDRVYTLK